jgi:glycosyltransferase involved in cell wall biosynthesis
VHVRRWSADLAARGCEVAVLSLGPAAPIPGVRLHHVRPTPRLLRPVRGGLDARRFLKQYRPDIVHVHFAYHDSRALWALGAERLVVTPYGSDVEALPAGLRGVVARRLLRTVLRRARAVVTASAYLMDRTEAFGALPDPAVREVIGFGVDWRRFAAAERPPRGRAPIVIGYAKGLHAYYGPLVLLDAIARLRNEAVPVRLRVAGQGPLAATLAERASVLGIEGMVEWPGELPDHALPAFFGDLDLFAMPSHREAYGVAALEAAAAGVPVVASRVGGIPEVVADGESGLLVPPGDAAALADALAALARDPGRRRQMGAAGRCLVRERHDRSRAVDRMLALYARVLAG